MIFSLAMATQARRTTQSWTLRCVICAIVFWNAFYSHNSRLCALISFINSLSSVCPCADGVDPQAELPRYILGHGPSARQLPVSPNCGTCLWCTFVHRFRLMVVRPKSHSRLPWTSLCPTPTSASAPTSSRGRSSPHRFAPCSRGTHHPRPQPQPQCPKARR